MERVEERRVEQCDWVLTVDRGEAQMDTSKFQNPKIRGLHNLRPEDPLVTDYLDSTHRIVCVDFRLTRVAASSEYSTVQH